MAIPGLPLMLLKEVDKVMGALSALMPSYSPDGIDSPLSKADSGQESPKYSLDTISLNKI